MVHFFSGINSHLEMFPCPWASVGALGCPLLECGGREVGLSPVAPCCHLLWCHSHPNSPPQGKLGYVLPGVKDPFPTQEANTDPNRGRKEQPCQLCSHSLGASAGRRAYVSLSMGPRAGLSPHTQAGTFWKRMAALILGLLLACPPSLTFCSFLLVTVLPRTLWGLLGGHKGRPSVMVGLRSP